MLPSYTVQHMVYYETLLNLARRKSLFHNMSRDYRSNIDWPSRFPPEPLFSQMHLTRYGIE